jgi:hypothetical protein
LASVAGQTLLVPVQLSAASHTPAAARQTVVFGANPSAGHVVLPPQVSAASQVPVESRQTVAGGAAVWEIAPVDVLHESVVQILPSSKEDEP